MTLEPGATLGRYCLVDRLGEGGMGQVWRAHDANLGRDVAIKVLSSGGVGDPETRARFRREAHVLSRLSHPGVATIYDFDAQGEIDFLVMELVPGGTLEARLKEGALPLDEVARIGAAVSDALHEAHERGVLHRDLKPANIVLTTGGAPKILDFGIAMLMHGDPGAAKLTRAGMILGSLPYMAPEQLTGDADDARTDIYALGVMLFEMTTGRRPFVKERAEALMFEIFGNAPPTVRSLRPDAPDALDQLVAACLGKEPDARPATAAEVGATLRGMLEGATTGSRAAPSRDVIRAIAVLPLRNVSGDPTQEYFADGMTEAIISDLSRIQALRVISRTSAMQYKASQKSLPEIARELNVDAVLEGSALLLGDRLRLTVQLVTARSDSTLWAERYDRKIEDVLDLQSELSATVAREIAVQLTPGEATPLTRHGAIDPEAHLAYLRARHSINEATREAMEVGMRHARRALEIDPRYAPAWSAMAMGFVIGAIRGIFPPADAVREGTAAATRALELNPDLDEAHCALGIIKSHTGELREGIKSLERAIALNPGNATAHNLLARALFSFERFDEALVSANRSVQLDPLSTLIRTTVGDTYYFARDYEKSVFHYRMAIELDSRFDGAHTDVARSLEMLGRFDEARAAYEEGRRLAGGVAGPSFGLAHLEAASGNEAEARRILAELTAARSSRVVSAWGIAAVHASLGDIDDAFHWLETAIAEHASGLILLRVHPRLDPIRNDARYWPMVERVGLA